jgi:tRNA 2-thiocytidine biosynthesis protein TtcA
MSSHTPFAGDGAVASRVERRVLQLVGRAMGRFDMLRSGDRIAVAVSGGKDSLCLLDALVAYRRRAPFPYELTAVTIEQGKFTAPIGAIESRVRALGVPWVLRDDRPTLRLVSEGIAHGCDVCSRHRRGVLYRAAAETGATVLALGHTADDCAESLLRNILFNGRIASLPPVAQSRTGTMRLIRPLVFVSEGLTRAYAETHGLPTVKCVCSDQDGPRRELRRLLADLEARHPGVPASISAALGNVHPHGLFDPAVLERASAGTARDDEIVSAPRPYPSASCGWAARTRRRRPR